MLADFLLSHGVSTILENKRNDNRLERGRPICKRQKDISFLTRLQFNLNINVTFPNIPCAILSLDIVDVTGVHMVNLDGRIHKHSLNKDGSKLKTTDAVSILD